MKILLIDRTEEIRTFFLDEITQLGCSISTTDSFKHSMEIWSLLSPDIVFCGGRIDDGDTLQFLKNIRQEYGKSVCIYIMSSYPLHQELDYVTAGANGFIDKTKGLNQVIDCILAIKNKVTLA